MIYVSKSCLSLGILIISPVYFAGKSFTNTNNSTNIQKNEDISGLAYWHQEKLFDEKNQG